MPEIIEDFGFPLIGKTIREIRGGTPGDGTMLFLMTDGSAVGFYHEQDCCESVAINDVCGDLADLIGSPLLQAEESSSGTTPDDLPAPEYEPESQTWTFYKFATIKGSITVRWLGESNGYYSESVEMVVFGSNDTVRNDFLMQHLPASQRIAVHSASSVLSFVRYGLMDFTRIQAADQFHSLRRLFERDRLAQSQ